MKLETAEIKLSVNDILEKGKEFGKKGAKIIKKEEQDTNTKEMKKLKKKDKDIEV